MSIKRKLESLQKELKSKIYQEELFLSSFNLNFDDNDNYQQIFKNLFEEFSKEDIFNKPIFDIKRLSRTKHTYMVFLLGYLIYAKSDIKKYFLSTYYEIDEKQFQLIWFITSIVHDIFFDIEEKKVEDDYKDLNNDITSIETKFKIKNYLKDRVDFTKRAGTKSDKFLGILENYYKYRYSHDDKIDHGIVSGIVIFDLLVKHRKSKKQNTIYWKEELDKLYFEASLSISSHNIWASDSKLKDKNYQDFNLNILIPSDKNCVFPIKFSEMPFLFLLGLVDTIEPTKTFRDKEFSYILNNLDITVKTNYIQLSNLKNSDLDFSKLTKKVIGLEAWLDVKVCIKNNEMKISWN